MKFYLLSLLALWFCAEAIAIAIPEHNHGQAVASIKKKKTKTPSFPLHQLYNMTTDFFDQFIYPKNVVQAKMINSTLFADNVLGRVDVTRNFNGRELNTEYAFGLFATLALNPGSFSLLGVPSAYNITHFTANQNIISLSVIVDFKIAALGITNPVEIGFWATFNKEGQIDQYDASFRYLQWQFDALLGMAQKALGVNNTAQFQVFVGEKLASSICATEHTHCTGDNQQYESEDSCFKYLTQDVRFGQAYEMGMNTLLCRMVHQNMVPARPNVHCSHIGPTGGGYCTDDRTYAATVTQSIFTNHPFVPYGLGVNKSTVASKSN